jgi:hypothetical protein
MGRTKGESLFEQYLAERAIGFDYETDQGGSRPDYRLKTEPMVYCEVKDFEFGPEDRAEMEAFTKGNRVGSKGSDALFGRIRDASGKAAKQLRNMKGSPCVVVLHNADSLVNFAPVVVGGAMFGNPAVAMPIGGGVASAVFTGGRVLGDTKNSTVSAVAVLSRVNANQNLIDETMARVGPWRGPGLPPPDRIAAVVQAMNALLDERPEAGLKVPYVSVHHNPFAVAPLPEQIFVGTHDRHVRYVP